LDTPAKKAIPIFSHTYRHKRPSLLKARDAWWQSRRKSFRSCCSHCIMDDFLSKSLSI